MQTRRNEKIYQTLGKDAVSTKTPYRWFDRFRNGNFSLEDEQRSERLIEIYLSELMRV